MQWVTKPRCPQTQQPPDKHAKGLEILPAIPTSALLEVTMEFLLLWVLGGNVLDSGLRYENAGSCYAAAQNSGKDLQEVGLAPPKFTCVPVAEGKELKLLVPEQHGSRFPF